MTNATPASENDSLAQSLSVETVRKHFPAFDRVNSEQPSTACFFENAGGTFPARYVVDHLQQFYLQHKVQPYGATPLQQAAGDAMDLGRNRMAELLDMSVGDLVLGPSTTQNFNTLATGFTNLLKPGDEIIVSAQDHEANIGAWLRAAKLAGAEAKFWPVDPQSGQLQIDTLQEMLSPRTRLVSLTHSSNIVGAINPLESIASTIRDAVPQRVYLIADGVSYAPHGLPDIKKLAENGIDAYSFSTYKTFGTHLGVMYVNPELTEQLTPQCHYFNASKSAAYRFDAAGPDHAAIAGLAGIADYFDKLYLDIGGSKDTGTADRARKISQLIKQHEQKLVEPVLECLNKKAVRIHGSVKADAAREANIAFSANAKEITSAELNSALAKKGIAAGHGNFYAPRVLESMGITDLEDGVVRLSFAHYNSSDEVHTLVNALDTILTDS